MAALGGGAEAHGASPLHTAPAPSASVAEAWGGVCGHQATAAVCAMSGEGYGYEAAGSSPGVPPPPLCDAAMTEEEVQQLQSWLAEAAAELYGPPVDEVAEDEVARLVRRGTTILQNSQLTASVFGLVEREGAAWRVAAARAGAARGAAWQPAGLEVPG